MSLALTNKVVTLSAGLVKLSATGESSVQCLDRQQAMLVKSVSSSASVNKRAPRRLRCQASQQDQERNEDAAPDSGNGINLNFIPPPVNETPGTFGEVMAFSGPAPEIVNGRLAMWGFLWGAIGELTGGTTLGQQFSSAPVGTIWTASVLIVASFLPSLISEVPFGELLDTASDVGLPDPIKPFNNRVEILNARLAMLGFAGFMGIEAVTGAPTLSLIKGLVGI